MSNGSDRTERELRALASRERRAVLEHFVATETAVADIEVLCCKVASARADGGGESPSTDPARVELHHVHLPTLADCDLVEYDSRSGTVRYKADEAVEELLAALATFEAER
ncbi:DUF7344 domain-containing protein [Halorussus marinus]|uniref:DUF7344 domain-containing protein n=1 Tax=Halorussus marinus TaxID=2505976 RepID=UPI00106E1205|nr:hypothetical protein [Halorussus marinus]